MGGQSGTLMSFLKLVTYWPTLSKFRGGPAKKTPCILVTWWCFTFTKQAPRKALVGGGSSGAASRAIASAAGGAGVGVGKNMTIIFFESLINFYIGEKVQPLNSSLTCVCSSCWEKRTWHATRNIIPGVLQGPPLGSIQEGTVTTLNRLLIGRKKWLPSSSNQVEPFAS